MPTRIIIDDRLPIKDNGQDLIMGQGWFWFSILEKAFAKLNVNYLNLDNGGLSTSARELTGMPVHIESFKELRSKSPYEHFKIMTKAL